MRASDPVWSGGSSSGHLSFLSRRVGILDSSAFRCQGPALAVPMTTMHRLLALAVVTATLPGCFLFFDDHGKGGEQCLLPPNGDDVPPQPGEAQPAPQRNPDTLVCQSFGGGGTCDPACGPCPLSGEEGTPTDALAPLPSWGFCIGQCESLDEATCETDANCRVIRDARCAVSGDCLTDFVGCVATDQFVDQSIACVAATDGQSCSLNPDCTAYHRENICGGGLPREDPPQECSSDFAFCGPEGGDPGRCHEPAACDRLPPNCPTGTTPGVADGCYTDICIPDDLCELLLNQ